MPDLRLGPLLRYVDERRATIWVETGAPATVSVLGYEARTFTVHAHHYALVVVEGLEPGSTTPYEVAIDGDVVWPDPDSAFPPSVIRTPSSDRDTRVLFGSCRAAAPHEPPFTLERMFDHEGRGVDSLWAHAARMCDEPSESWPDLLLFVGDQVYADDSSPQAKERIEACRSEGDDLPSEIVAGYEEYCWLYRESWSLPYERWVLSTVASVMIFDDHDMIDDWNISRSWVDDIRREPWWQIHARGGFASYWVHQHLGNQSPEEIAADGLLAAAVDAGDATTILEKWADRCEAESPVDGGYRFSFARTVGDVTVVVIDCRNGRVLEGGERSMVGDDEWEWVREQARAADGHVILATSVPVFIADGLHDFQVWSERVCDSVWGRRAGRVGERIRRALDLEDWSAFERSYHRFVELVNELSSASSPPKSIVVASGDIHFSYAARVGVGSPDGPTIWQVVSSPIRNALIPHERGVMRFTLTRAGRAVGAALRRSVRALDSRPGLDMAAGPYFANNMCELRYEPDGSVELVIEHATPDGDGQAVLDTVAQVALVD